MEWLENNRGQHRSELDGEVIVSLEKKPTKRIRFLFRKSSFYKIISEQEFVIVAKDGNRIYFKESKKGSGFALSRWTPTSRVFKISCNQLHLREEDFGEYNLEYDSELHLHYICLLRKLEKTLKWEGK